MNLVSRWIAALTLVVLVAFASDASAQVFKPRGGSKNAPATKKTAPAAAASKKQPTRTTTTTPRRVVTTKAPAKKSRVAKGRPSDLTPDAPKKDDVIVKDDDDDDVIIVRDD